ncbi:MAG: TMEM175 family protein [Mycobacterium sp.]
MADDAHQPSEARAARHNRLFPLNRLEAFSDGVFAIVITLLVLDLHVPADSDRLLAELVHMWPSFLGYLVSFAFIGGSWVGHTGLTQRVRTADGVFVSLNLLQLLFVSFLPFTTKLFTTHMTDTGQRVAVVAFGLNLTVAAVVAGMMATYACRADRVSHDEDRAGLAWLERERWAGVVLMVLTTAVSAVFPKIAVIFYLAVSTLLILLPVWRMHRVGRARRHVGSPKPNGTK